MNEKTKNLIEAVENILDLLIEGLTDSQNENWSQEIDNLLDALHEARTPD